jgi:hypothetical protein
MPAWARRWGPLAIGLLGVVALTWLAWWQFRWLGTDLETPISHGINEDWDWQLGFYEASRISLMEHGQLPAWNPYVQGGVPLLANPESPFLYPPFLLVLVFGSSAGLKLWVLFHLAALAGAAWWAGRAQGLGPIEAHAAGLLMLCSAQLPQQTAMGHIMYLPLCWLPLAWIASRAGRWRLAGLCLAMPVLAGAHHVFLYALLLLGVDAIFRMLDPKRAWALGLWLLLNLMLLGQGWALWPMAALGLAALGWQRPHPRGRLWVEPAAVAGAVLLAALLCGPKLLTVPTLWARAERLAPQLVFSIADDYGPWRALQVLLGLVDRPSAHNGQNVLYGAAPLLLAGLGLVASAPPWPWPGCSSSTSAGVGPRPSTCSSCCTASPPGTTSGWWSATGRSGPSSWVGSPHGPSTGCGACGAPAGCAGCWPPRRCWRCCITAGSRRRRPPGTTTSGQGVPTRSQRPPRSCRWTTS